MLKKVGGAFVEFDGKISKLSVSGVSDIKKSRIVTRYVHGEEREIDKMINVLPAMKQIPEGTVGIKVGLIAEQKADIHIHTNTRANKWDTCAPQIIIEEAGGKMSDFEGKELDYLQESPKWKNSFVASNAILHNEVIKYIQDYYKKF